MRIWCIWDGHDLLGLMSVLQCYDHEFHLISDHAIWPASSKNQDRQRISIQKLVTYAEWLAIDYIIVPPAYESLIKSSVSIVPLFKSIISNFVAPDSIVNKRGIVWDESFELGLAQEYALSCVKDYSPVFKQSNNKHFQVTPKITQLSVTQMKYHLLTYGKQDRLMRKSRKFELRSLKDAAIDTLVPANYSMLHREKIRRHHLNRKKINVVWEKQIQEIFEGETQWKESDYSVTIHSTDPEGFERTFLSHKKWRWMLERGKGMNIIRNKVV
jgi:hypothetical protein